MKNSLFKLTLIAAMLSSMTNAATVDLRVLETTDLHGNMLDYDYYKDSATDKYGLARTATLINNARAEVKNSVLVDNGDIIQGSPMADYMASKGLTEGEIHPVYKALNTLQYTVGSLGNHEFNYGLDYLKASISGAKFPYINSNVFDANTGKNYFKPYLIVDTPVTDREGNTHTVRIGYIGFVPPQIMQWDKKNLEGKVIVKDITETAQQLVPQLRKEGADIIIAIAHSGVSSDPYKAMAENSTYYLTQVPGINAVMFGHSHGVFPSKNFEQLKGADITKGMLNGVPVVMPGQWGSHLGVVDLQLEGETGKWEVVTGTAQARPVFDSVAKKSLAARYEPLATLLQEDHKNTRAFANQPIGKSSDNIYSFLALVQDDPSIQVVNDAQKAYVQYHIQGDPDLADLPVLAATAPFKAGGRKNDPNGYIEIGKGEMTFRNAADIYVYSNTISVVKVSGAELQQWLECSAGLFNQIDVNSAKPQFLINWDARTYILDTIDGVNYQIDVTQPARYDKSCKLINKDASRILNLSYQGKPVDPKAQFLIATDNYRTDTGNYAGTGLDRVVFASPDEVRSVVAEYVNSETKKQGYLKPTADKNWQIAQITTASQPLDIRVETSPSKTAAEFIKQNSDYPMSKVGTDEIGFAVYKINLQSKPTLRSK